MPHTLLLADDSVTIQRVIELTFAEEDIRVIAVGDGKQAIDRIQSDRPDIVLADVGMPERDGYEVAAFVKGNPELAHVPVLLLTGAFEPIDEPRARSAGCDGVLVKPFEPQMVINRVKDLLAGRRPAGLWAAAPAVQPTRQPPPMDVDIQPPPASAPKQSENLDEYFDRLDAVFADLDATPGTAAAPQPVPFAPQPVPLAPPPAPAPAPPPQPRPQPAGQARQDLPGDVLADWDPELTGDPTRPSPIRDTPPAAAPAPPAGEAPPPATARSQPIPVSVAADVPAAPVATSAGAAQVPQAASLAEAFAALLAAEHGQAIAAAATRPADIPQDTIDSIVARVLERVTSDAVRKTVADVAERLVRDEIARIKRGG